MQHFNKSGKTQISIIIPTLNEQDNIGVLIEKLMEVFRPTDYGVEILVADGGSSDATQSKVQALAVRWPLRFIPANSGRGLAGDVLVAAQQAEGDVIVVMDADLSHPPQLAPNLAKLVLEDACDMAIGVRFAYGGRNQVQSWLRKVISRGAVFFAQLFVDVSDPTSGFFALRRQNLLSIDPGAAGFKIALEVLFSAGDNFRVQEVPYSFLDRSCGRSKMSAKQVRIYLSRLMALTSKVGVACNALRFALVSLVGLVVDLGIFHILWSKGMRLSSAHIVSFFIAGWANYALSSRWSFRPATEQHFSRKEYTKFLALGLIALFLRGGVLVLFMQQFNWSAPAALIVAIFVTAAVNYLGIAFFVLPQGTTEMRGMRWRITTLSLIGYALLLRLVYLGLPNLLGEEAYYWNYAQHPAFGYLDHPPMVAWVIKFGTLVFKHSEFGVRFGAFLCWFVTAGFSFGFARNLFEKKTALQTLLFLSLLPLFFFVAGFFIMPDVPLFAAWAGALFFLERALLAKRRLAWWGVGICLGLGMLSKYSIALLVLTAFLFILSDRPSRRWLLRPEPYVAMLLALLIFTPVILWNANNNWASFFFQSTRRLRMHQMFSLHILVGYALVLLTPLGAIGVAQSMFSKRIWDSQGGALQASASRRRLFSLIFTLVPLAVFALFSIKHQPKMDWTCPVWLAIMPAFAKYSLPEIGPIVSRRESWWQRTAMPTLVVLAVIYGAFLHYISIGLPGVPYPKYTASSLAWREMGDKVEQIENMIEGQSGEKPLVVGRDKYFIASELAFYRKFSKQGAGEGFDDTSSANLFDDQGLMYEWWFPWERQIGKTCIIVGINPDKLSDNRIARFFESLDPIQEVCVSKDKILGGCFFYRIAKKYLGKNYKIKGRI